MSYTAARLDAMNYQVKLEYLYIWALLTGIWFIQYATNSFSGEGHFEYIEYPQPVISYFYYNNYLAISK